MAAGRLIWPLIEPVLGTTGSPVAGAILRVYENRSTDLATIYADKAMATPVANPQSGANASNAAGRFFAQTKVFWADSAELYTLRVERPDGSFDVIDDIAPQTSDIGTDQVIYESPGGEEYPVSDKLDLWITPLDYGCVMDGTTDDSVAWQACVDAAGALDGGQIDLGGHTIYTDAWTVPAGRGLAIRNGKMKVKGNAHWMSGASGQVNFFTMDNIYIDASELTTEGRRVIDWSKFAYSTFRRLWIFNNSLGKATALYCAGDGIIGPYYNLFELIYSGGLFREVDIADAASVAYTVNNNTFRNFRFNPGAVGRKAIYVGTENQHNKFESGVIEDTVGGTGIEDDGIGTQISSVRFENLTLAMNFLENARGGTDEGCYFDSNDQKRVFADADTEASHNISAPMNGDGSPDDNTIAGGLTIGGGIRSGGDPGFPMDLIDGESFSYASPTLGGVLGGRGSTNDTTLVNRSGQTVGRVPANSQIWALEGPLGVKSYTVGTVPSAAVAAGHTIYVSNEAGGATLAASNGTNWRRTSDNANIS